MDKDRITKKEDTKENAMETQRVFVENWPKTKKWWIELAEITIAIAALSALGVSIHSVNLSRVSMHLASEATHLARQDLITTHRPYVYAISRLKKNGTMDVDTVLLGCFNAPARIINRELYYVAVKTKENGEESHETIYEDRFPGKFIVYPFEKLSSQVTVPYDFKKEILAKDQNIKLQRKIRIDYKELSSDRTYWFEGNWDYNADLDIWVDKNMSGD